MILFLDDDKSRQKTFLRNHINDLVIIVETAQEAISALSKEYFEVVYLDHDLGGEVFVDPNRKDTGMEVVRWIIANQQVIPKIIIHSYNGLAAKLMLDSLTEACYHVEYIPFSESL